MNSGFYREQLVVIEYLKQLRQGTNPWACPALAVIFFYSTINFTWSFSPFSFIISTR